MKEVNPHDEKSCIYQVDEYGNCVEQDLNIITAPLNI